MKLVVVSHACSEPINQSFFARVESLAGWDVTIVLPSRWRSHFGARRAERLSEFKGRLLCLHVGLSGNIPLHWYLARLHHVLAEEEPDAIYVHNEAYAVATFQAFVANRLSRRAPIGFYGAQNLVKHYPWPFAAAERYVYKHASFALPISPAADRVLRAKGYRGRAAVLPLGVDLRLYSADQSRNGERPAKPFVVGFVGRMAPEKGPDTLLGALELLQPDRFETVLVGDGPLTSSLKLRAAAAGLEDRLDWTGYVPHDLTPDVYRRMDVLVVPSRSQPGITEQFGRTVIEALACGVPVVTSDCGELPQMVAATEGGWVFPEGDAAALARILAVLRTRPGVRREAAERGRRAVQEQFDLDRLAQRFATAIEDVVSRSGRR